MAPISPLLVPVQVQALVVNPRVRAQGFQRWSMDYTNLAAYVSPEPPPFSGGDPDWASDPLDDGVHLHWTLPVGLRHGVHQSATGTTTFHLVPNRWLVVRMAGPVDTPDARTATSWVVESDHLGPDGTVPYLDPAATTPTPTLIGRALPLERWAETGTRPAFLTAVAPGDVAFAAYQPHVMNVFSLHDPVTEVREGEVLSYLVAGWYSQPSADILAGPDDYATVLADLGWTSAGPQSARTSVFHGIVRGLVWSGTAIGRRPAATRLAVGNTSVDALTALIRWQAAERQRQGIDPDLLEAFQYDLLRSLDQPDGPALLETRIHDAWFGSRSGGSTWEVVATPPDGDTQAALQESTPVPQPAWLPALNQAQARYDQAVRELESLRGELYETWWKRGNAAALPDPPEGLTDTMFAAALDPALQGGIAGRVVAQLAVVASARSEIPWGGTQEELARAVASYTVAHPLAAGTELKRAELPPFRLAADPVVVIAGAHSDAFADDLGADPATGLLPCRFAGQVVTGLTIVGEKKVKVTSKALAGRLPAVDHTRLPAIPEELLAEFFLLDPANAATVASVAFGTADPENLAATAAAMTAATYPTGTPPAILPPPWTQPWAPLFLEWELLYYPIPYRQAGGGASPWSFDGTGYTWSGQGAGTADPIVLTGRSILTPQPTFTFKARLDAYLTDNPDVALSDLESFVESIDGWDLLSQTLSGFNAQLALRDPASTVAPDASTAVIPPATTMAALVGTGAVAMPVPGPVRTEYGVWAPSGFQPLRAGQFVFRRAAVVDRFGQSVDIVSPESAAAFVPIPAEGLAPRGAYALPLQTARFVQLPPRLLQPARLAAGFVSAVDDTVPLSIDGDANPVCAWILPNHLDQALECYAPDGAALGDLSLTISRTGRPRVSWRTDPGSRFEDTAALAPVFPHLAEFLSGLVAAGPDAFADLLTTIDATLWSIDPPGTGDETYLPILVGRPLALIRAALRCEFAEPARTDPSWPYTFAPQPAEVLAYSFPVRLGDTALKGDGLVGYLAGADTARFLAAHRPAEVTSPYITAIGPGTFLPLSFADTAPAYVTLLVDPQAPVHVFSDILPVTTLAVPQRFVASALGAMAVTLRAGPALTDLVAREGAPAPDVVLSRPAELAGTWSWVEPAAATGTTTYGITPADQAARFPSTAATIRTGWLQLSEALRPGPRQAPPDSPTGSGR
ncbi:hypothetical protein [Actinomadura napierensis]|uniref:Uncharacterized protein n=1 Tax=Actinomadura napierensis TaxID=267854 RepID=A0ABN2ZKT0_9ACTN